MHHPTRPCSAKKTVSQETVIPVKYTFLYSNLSNSYIFLLVMHRVVTVFEEDVKEQREQNTWLIIFFGLPALLQYFQMYRAMQINMYCMFSVTLQRLPLLPLTLLSLIWLWVSHSITDEQHLSPSSSFTIDLKLPQLLRALWPPAINYPITFQEIIRNELKLYLTNR